jgi:uncharacterized protein
MKIGNIDFGFDLDKVRSLLNEGVLSKEKCKNCWAFRFCILCCASSDSGHGLSSEIKTGKCQSVRNIAENNLKDICTLKENNFDFDHNYWLIST